MFEYGNLRFLEGQGWKFLTEDGVEDLEAEGFIEAFNKVGLEGWELVELEPEVGYMFKRSVK